VVNLDLVGRRALVTGGSRGLGRAISLMLAEAGAHVGVAYQSRHDEARTLAEEIEQKGVNAWSYGGDLSDPAEVERLFNRAIDEFGSLDIFVGNAGIWPSDNVPVSLMADQQWRETIAANLDSVFYCTRAAARVLSDDGRIVLIGSTAGQRGEAGHADYAATKGAIQSFVKSVCVELAAHNITVNCVAPGWIDTEMAARPYAGEGRRRIESSIPLGRIATPDDVAGAVVFLCSRLARHITGEVLNVNGGAVLCG
jgi:3-oxoacyl-[acyl-carrier protein] reductase